MALKEKSILHSSMKHLFSKRIINWYQKNKRDLPWRKTKDPYTIWLSEIILQQTRVAQGLPYFIRFIEKYPRIQDLAGASEEAVLKLWQGLGYYSRARNLHATAQYISNQLEGVFPKTYKDLLQLKGVGDYTASAIASFCYNEVTPTVDGNVYRVLSRFFGISTPINSGKAKKEFKQLAQELIDTNRPGLFNQALMEFGALQCIPGTPECGICPLAHACVALQKNQVTKFPRKSKKIIVKKRYLNYLVLQTPEKHTFVQKRRGKGIWQNMYEFPLVETGEEIDYKDLLQHPDFLAFTGDTTFTITLLTKERLIHKLSHQHLYIRFWLLVCPQWKGEKMAWQEVLELPVPIVVHHFIEDFLASGI